VDRSLKLRFGESDYPAVAYRIDAGGKGGDCALLETDASRRRLRRTAPAAQLAGRQSGAPASRTARKSRAQRLSRSVEVQAAYLEKLALGERTLLWDHELAELAPIMNALARRHQKIMMPPHR
jgi:hypothetical protein